ncbi:MAG: hypothetical protein IV090_16060 [Candidatus Sericytochromatia bacterium]|nr:hypothetical protein [Candidatus Sericytochromatia bacterium]
MTFKKVLLSLLAGSVFITGSGCTPEQLNLAVNLANQFLKDLESGNSASIDLQLVAESGQVTTVSNSDVEDVKIGGRKVKHRFNASGELLLEDFNLSDGAQAEAEVYLRGYQRPVIVVINPENQKRNNIRISAQVSVASTAQRNVVLDQRATITQVAKKDDLQEFLRNAVVFDLGSEAAAKLRGKQIVGVWLDGDRMPQNQIKVNTNGNVLMHTSAFLRFFMGLDAKGNFLNTDDSLTTVSFRNSNAYKKIKENLRKKVLREKARYVQTRVVTETRVVVTKKVVTERRFVTQQVRGVTISQTTLENRLRLQLALNRLDAQKRAEIERKAQEEKTRLAAAERQKLEARLAELKQRQAELNARRPQSNVQVVRVGNQTLESRQLASIRGLAATKLARDSKVYKNRTLYVLTRSQSGKMQLFKFVIKGKQVEVLAQRLEQRLNLAKQRADRARQRFSNAKGSVNVDELLGQVAVDVDTLADLNEAGDLVCETQVEDLDASSEAELSVELASAEGAEQAIMEEEIETELGEELSDVLVDASTEPDEDLGVELLASDITQAASESNVSAVPEESIVSEDQINLASEVQASAQVSEEVDQSVEQNLIEEILVAQAQEES